MIGVASVAHKVAYGSFFYRLPVFVKNFSYLPLGSLCSLLIIIKLYIGRAAHTNRCMCVFVCRVSHTPYNELKHSWATGYLGYRHFLHSLVHF